MGAGEGGEGREGGVSPLIPVTFTRVLLAVARAIPRALLGLEILHDEFVALHQRLDDLGRDQSARQERRADLRASALAAGDQQHPVEDLLADLGLAAVDEIDVDDLAP